MDNLKPTALFLMSPAKGHLNASFGLARVLLAQSNYSIVYAVPFELHSYVSQQGFECVLFAGLPFGINGEQTLDYLSNSQRVKYFDNLIDRFYDTIYNARKTAIERLIQQTKPQLVLLDSFQSADFILLYPILKAQNIQFVFVQTMLSFHQQADNLPLDCPVVPNQKTNFSWHWQQYYFKRRLRSLWQNIIYLGKSNRRIIEQKAKKQGLNEHHLLDYQQSFRVGFANVPELIVAPQALEFTHQKQQYQHYLGLLVDLERKEPTNESFSLFLNSLPQNKKIIYCSFGTLYADFGKRKDILRFFNNLLEVAKKLPDYVFVVSLSESFRKEFSLSTIPFNVYFFEFVPQLTILKRSSLFITHGGLNSIRESIALKVAMLVYPVDLRWDQPSNAAKIEHHGLGLKGNMAKDNATELESKIIQLLHEDIFRQRLSCFTDNNELVANEGLLKKIASE
ncbi:MAG: hypothetical protein EAZ32_18100 [Cytophagia bacterium]|nr:MAG: hypothetical protein EAZ46_11850 [Runella sp.]TAG16387.1 MAG: hypothetical protein EAZ38_18825 [Cytophagales bacterium]TAG35628.1 MAG: hypothetical protein EAZ32_18100 [Cytophagia bacterium]TAG50870.1 MAG: hypothetical protein EAZ29_11425 [Runella slithyformis]TAG69391.1 MAG: hypothetical protein EAZ26_07070 [Runella slithyformis]